MKKITLIITMVIAILFTGCNPMNKTLNPKNFEKIKKEIKSNDDFSQMKKNFIVDNLSEDLSYQLVRKTTGLDISEYNITYKECINKYSNKFDSLSIHYKEIENNNKKLENFVELIDANVAAIDEYKGYLSMELKFNNVFDKEILYIILNYKYVNEYDSEYFDEKSKLTDKVANDFKENVVIMTTEEYNDVARFIYKEVPVNDKETTKKFLLDGLKIETLGIIFKDKTELFKEEIYWDYYE